MQSSGYLPGYYYPRDHNVILNGSIPHNDITWNSSTGFSIPFPQFAMNQNQDFVLQKEILRQVILKHEATFRYQVNELHRLYGRQRELMHEIKRRKLVKDHLHLQVVEPNAFMSQLRSEIFEKTCWPIANLTSIKLAAPSKETFHDSSNSTGKTGDYFSGQNVSKDCNLLSSKSNISRKRMFDLELPAEEHIDNEEDEVLGEENPAKRSNIMISELQPQCLSKVNFVFPGGSSTNLSSCRGTTLLFDLNEPVQPVESEYLNSALESDNINEEIKERDQDLSRRARAECSTLNKEGSHGSNLNMSDQFYSIGRELVPCNQPASFPPEVADKSQAETRTDKSLPISSWRKHKEIPIAVQALPCFTTEASFGSSPKSSVRNSRVIVKKFNHYQASASTQPSGSFSSCFSDSAVKDNKVSDYTSSVEGMDLNLTPPTYLPDYHSVSTSNTYHPNSPEGRNTEIQNSEVLDSSMVLDSAPESIKCTRDNHFVGIDSKLSATNICIDLNSCIKEELLPSGPSEATKPPAEGDVKGPVSPENKEGSPPRGDSQDILISTSIYLRKSGQTDPVEELDRVAADTLLFISGKCLDWLAEVAASVASNPEEVELLSDRTKCSPVRKLIQREVNIVNSHCHLKVAKEKEEQIALCNQLRGQARRKKDQDIQSAGVDSLLRQVHGTKNSPGTGSWKKTSSSRSKRRSNDGEKIMCLLLLQHNNHGISDRFLKGWGMTKRRQRARRAQSYLTPLF